MNYEIIDKTEDYLIINKPAGLLTHGSEHIQEPTLAELLLKDHPEIAGIGEDPDRPGIMHRLDRLVSGLLAVALTQESFDDLKRQFKERSVEKWYTGIVHGQLSKEEDVINFPLKRSSKGHKMAAIPETFKGKNVDEGRKAITEFRVAQKFINFTLLKIRIRTGRTHQIRAHMSAYGHPLLGDDVYGTKKTRAKNAKIGLKRIFRVADRLAFTDLRGERKEYEIDLPEELKNIMPKIK